jgi:hypothetical protein
MRNALAEFVYRHLYAWFIRGSMMKCIINVTYSVIQQGENIRVGQLLAMRT